MGNRKTLKTWSWSLLSYPWLPELISILEKIPDPSWSGFRRELLLYAANEGIGNKIFNHVKTFLVESRLVIERRNLVSPSVDNSPKAIRAHINSLYESSNEPWAQYFREISLSKQSIVFNEINQKTSQLWPEIGKYPTFKMWAELFQFLGLGFYLNSNELLPSTAITAEMTKDVSFINQCCRCHADPRHLTGKSSRHAEADFLSWTRGEDSLIISDDKDFDPRIDTNQISRVYHATKSPDAFYLAINEGKKSWHETINEHIKRVELPDLTSLVLTIKAILDFFIFGKDCYSVRNDLRGEVNKARLVWESVPGFSMRGGIWHNLSKFYLDVFKLSYGITHFRNSLNKVIDLKFFVNPDILQITSDDLEKVKGLPIRCHKSKRKLYGILKNMRSIVISLNRVNKTNTFQTIKFDVSKTINNARLFLPENPIESSETVENCTRFVELSEIEKYALVNSEWKNPICDYQHQLLQLAYWVHFQYQINNDTAVSAIKNIRNKIDHIEKNLTSEINHYSRNFRVWENSYERFLNETNLILNTLNEKS